MKCPKCGNASYSEEGNEILEELRWMENHETSKIVVIHCQDCGLDVQVLCNETAKIVGVRCAECYSNFRMIKENEKE